MNSIYSEFLEALQSSINQMSADGIRISYVASKGRELGSYMADTLDSQWKASRGDGDSVCGELPVSLMMKNPRS